MATLTLDRPLISFTFDDFPTNAFDEGGKILAAHGIAGTYYVSLGLLGTVAPTGRIVTADRLPELLAAGHELGCHTYSHLHSWSTAPAVFERDVLRNRLALKALVPSAVFESFSYPISEPRPGTKMRTAPHFRCSRLGGQRANVGRLDLNQMSAFFLEKTRGDIAPIRRLLDETVGARGWLVFATHDVAESPTPFGCTPSFFEQVVRLSRASGASILPVARALDIVLRG